MTRPAPTPASKSQRSTANNSGALPPATPVRNSTMRQPYIPSELTSPVRTGALDAYALPSIQLGKRITPRRPDHGN